MTFNREYYNLKIIQKESLKYLIKLNLDSDTQKKVKTSKELETVPFFFNSPQYRTHWRDKYNY